jgi:F-type H+-transporting ATPase subunit gamma
MASLQSLRRKISSVKNTQKITKAMKMVAAAKLKRAQDRILSARPYAIRMRQVLERVSHRVSPSVHPLFRRRPGNKVLVVVVTSDRGLCGAFNANVLRRGVEILEEHKARGAEVSVSVIGRKGLDYFRRRSWPIRHKWPGVFDRLTYEHGKDIGQELIDDYTNESFDELYAVHNEFKSVMQQEIRVRKGLPIDLREGTEPPDTAGGHYLYEPSEDEIFSGLEEVMYILTGTGCTNDCDGWSNQKCRRAYSKAYVVLQQNSTGRDYQRTDGYCWRSGGVEMMTFSHQSSDHCSLKEWKAERVNIFQDSGVLG